MTAYDLQLRNPLLFEVGCTVYNPLQCLQYFN